MAVLGGLNDGILPICRSRVSKNRVIAWAISGTPAYTNTLSPSQSASRLRSSLIGTAISEPGVKMSLTRKLPTVSMRAGNRSRSRRCVQLEWIFMSSVDQTHCASVSRGQSASGTTMVTPLPCSIGASSSASVAVDRFSSQAV